MSKLKWFIYVVFVSFLPFFMRGMIYLSLERKDIAFLCDETDFIIFSLIMNVTAISELEGRSIPKRDHTWRTVSIGISVLLVVIVAGLLSISIISKTPIGVAFDVNSIKILASAVAITSFLVCYAVVYKITSSGA